jgi:hypothetical protein
MTYCVIFSRCYFFFLFRLSTKSCLVLFFDHAMEGGKEMTAAIPKPFFCVSYWWKNKTKQDRKTANQFLSSWPPSRRKPPHVEGDAERRRVERDSTELVNMHHMKNDFRFFFFFSVVSFFIVCMKQFKFHNARYAFVVLLISRRRPAFLRRDFF